MGVTVTRSANVRDWFEVAGRCGLAARGAVYCLLGALAIALATGNRGAEETDQRGALAELATHTGGKLALIVLIVGFLCYAAWRLLRVFYGEGGDEPSVGSRLLDVAKA